LAVVHCDRKGHERQCFSNFTSPLGDTCGTTRRAGHGAGLEVDAEVVAGEPAPGTGARNGIGLITATCFLSTSAARAAPVP
jgi:hypothetical protein